MVADNIEGLTRPVVSLPGTPTLDIPTRIYDIRDMIVRVPQFRGPRFEGGQTAEMREEEYHVMPEGVENLVNLTRETIDPTSWRTAGGEVGSIRELTGLLIVTQTWENHMALCKLLTDLRKALPPGYRPPDEPEPPPLPEAMFNSDGHLMPWVLDLLGRARQDKLSEFSSVQVRKVGGRTFARIGGYWLDTDLTLKSKVCVIVRNSPAAEALLGALPALRECLGFDSYVIACVSPAFAVCLDLEGIHKIGDPLLLKVLETVKKNP